MSSAIAGFLNTVGAQTNDLVGEFQEAVLARHAKGFNSGAVLFGLMAKLANEPADNAVFNWWERDPATRTFYATAAVTGLTSATTITFGASASDTTTAVYALLNKGDVLYNDNTKESVLVTADATSNATVVARSNNGILAGISAGDRFTIITRAATEGDVASRAQYEQPSLSTNYIQSFNQVIELSRLYKGQVLRTDSDGPLRETRIQALERISNDIELAYLFGTPKVSVGSTGGNIYQTGGIKAVVDAFGATQNILNGNGTTGVSLNLLNDWFYNVLTVGSDSKLLFAGPKAYAAISQFANSNAGGYRTGVSDRVFGMAIQEIITPNGSVGLVSHPLLKEQPAFNDWAFLVDLQYVTQKVLLPLNLEQNIQLPGQHTYKEQFYAQLGLKSKFPTAHGYAYGLSKVITS